MSYTKSLIASFFILASFLFTSGAQALEEKAGSPPAAPTPVSESSDNKAIILADVNIFNAQITEKSGSSFRISFDLANGVGSQSGIKYGIKLLSLDKKNLNSVVSEKAFDEEISLPQNSTVSKQIIYTAPSNLSGKYTMIIVANNFSGFPLGIGTLGQVELTSLNKGVELVRDSCYLTVAGEKGSPRYNIAQNVDIGFEEKLVLNCTAVNSAKAISTVTPFYETTALSTFGDIADTRGDGTMTPIIFKPLEKKSFSVNLPKALLSKMYIVRFGLLNNGLLSNTVPVSYLLRGANATIENASLDKDAYKNGDNAIISLIWNIRNNHTRLTASAFDATISAKTKITNANGAICAENTTSPLVFEKGSPISKLSLPIKNSCIDPKVEITLLGSADQRLDSKTFAFKTQTPEQEAISKVKTNKGFKNKMIPTIILAVLLLIAIITIYMKKRKVKEINKIDGTPSAVMPTTNKDTTIKPINKILPVIFLMVLLFGFSHSVSATTYYAEGLIIVSNMPANLTSGQSVTVSTSVKAANIYPCNSNYMIKYVNMDTSIGPAGYILDNNNNISISSFSGNSIFGQATFVAPTVTSSETHTLRLNVWGAESGVWCISPNESGGYSYFRGSHVIGTTGSSAGTEFSLVFGNNDMTTTFTVSPPVVVTNPLITAFYPNQGKTRATQLIYGSNSGTFLTVEVKNATSCTINRQTISGILNDGSVQTVIFDNSNGMQMNNLTRDTTYNVTCSN